MSFEPLSLAQFSSAYPQRAAALQHDFAHHAQATLPGLMVLAASLPRARVEVDDAEHTLAADRPSGGPGDGPSPAALLQSLAARQAVLRLHDVGLDRNFHSLLATMRRQVAPLLAADGGVDWSGHGAIYAASPGRNAALPPADAHRLLIGLRGCFEVVDAAPDEPLPDAALTHDQARFLPAGAALTLRAVSGPPVMLMLEWRSRALADQRDARPLTAWLGSGAAGSRPVNWLSSRLIRLTRRRPRSR